MSDIFGGTEVPRWLQAIAQPIDAKESGAEIGMLLGGAMRALQPDDEAKPNAKGKLPMKGLEKGLNEARMAHADPDWKLKHKALEAGVVGKWADAATGWQQFDSQARDNAEWLNHDIGILTKHAEALKTNPDAPLGEPMHSLRGIQAAAQLERAQIAAQNLKLRQDNAKTVLENQKTSSKFNQAMSAAPLAIQSAADELPNQGWNTDQNGRRTTPSQALLRLYNDWATENGKYPEKQFGYVPNAIEREKARGEEARKTEATRQTNRIALENVRANNREDLMLLTAEQKLQYDEQRQKDRLEIEKVRQDGRVDIEKLREASRTEKGKVLTRGEFINRHFNTLFTNLRKDAPANESPSETAARAERVLSGVYYRVDKEEKAKAGTAAPAKPTVPQTPPTAPFTPPASGGTTNKILKWDPDTETLK